MAIIRLEQNTPEVYSNESRDFQLLCRLYDCILNGVKFDIDSIEFANSGDYCNSRLLSLLQSKVGFSTRYEMSNETRRYIIKTFAYILKSKGTKHAIEEAVRVYLAAIKKQSSVEVIIVDAESEFNDQFGTKIYEPYSININTEVVLSDTIILDEILKYIAPTGYTIYYYPLTIVNRSSEIELKENLTVLTVSNQIGSQIKSSTDYVVSDWNRDLSRTALVSRLVSTINMTQVLSASDKLDVSNVLRQLEVVDNG